MIKYDDIRVAYNIYRYSLWEKYKQNTSSLLGDTTERASYLKIQKQEWRTNISVPMQQEMIDSMYAHIIDSEGIFRTDNIGIRNIEKGKPEVVEKLLNYVYEKSYTWDILLECIHDSITNGLGYYKTVWKKHKDSIEYMDGTRKKQTSLFEIDLPAIQYLSPFSVIVDPVATSLQTARWIAIRKFLSFGEILKEFNKYFGFEANEEEKLISLYNKKNEENINRNVIEREDLTLLKQQILLNILADQENINIQLTPEDKAKEVVEVIDRHGNVQLFIDGCLMYEGKTIYPFDGYPIHSISYDMTTGTFLSTGVCDKTRGYQQLINIYANTHSDNTKLAGTSAFTRVVTPGQNMFEGETELDIAPLKVFNVETPDGLKPLSLRVDDNMLEEMEYIKKSAQTAVGINEMVMGVQGKVERSASAVQNLMQSFKARMRPLFRSISSSMKRTGEQWLSMLVAFNSKDSNIKITTKRDDGEVEFDDIKVEDLHGKWDIKFSIAGLNSSMREIEKKQMQEILPILMSLRDVQGRPIVNNKSLLRKAIELWGFSDDLILTEEQLSEIMKQVQEGTQGEGEDFSQVSGSQTGVFNTEEDLEDQEPISEESEIIKESGDIF